MMNEETDLVFEEVMVKNERNPWFGTSIIFPATQTCQFDDNLFSSPRGKDIHLKELS